MTWARSDETTRAPEATRGQSHAARGRTGCGRGRREPRRSTTRTLILGGDDVGLALARHLRNEAWSVDLLDSDPTIVERAVRHDVPAHAVDITDVRELDEHDVEKVDVAIVASDSDSANLLAAQLLRVAFDVEHVVVRVNDARNIDSFEELGFVTVCASSALAESIVRSFDSLESDGGSPLHWG